MTITGTQNMLLFYVWIVAMLGLLATATAAEGECASGDMTCSAASYSSEQKQTTYNGMEEEDDGEDDDDDDDDYDDDDYDDDDEDDFDDDDEDDSDDEEEEDEKTHEWLEQKRQLLVPVSWGTPQRMDGKQKRGALEIFEMTRLYMAGVVAQLDHDDVRESCLVTDELCTFWASIGQCQENKVYMQLQCAPSCQTCHLLRYDDPSQIKITDYDSPVWGSEENMIEDTWKTLQEIEFVLIKPEKPIDKRRRFARKKKDGKQQKKRSRRSREDAS